MVGVFEKHVSDNECYIALPNGLTLTKRKDIIPAMIPVYKEN